MLQLKPLQTPITVIVDIRCRTWHQKSQGNVYCSVRATVNDDMDNEIVLGFELNGVANAQHSVLKKIAELYPEQLPANLASMYADQLRKAGIIVLLTVKETTKALAKQFGQP